MKNCIISCKGHYPTPILSNRCHLKDTAQCLAAGGLPSRLSLQSWSWPSPRSHRAVWPSVHAALRSLRSVTQVARLLMSCATGQQLFTASVPWARMHAKWLQSCPTLCNPMNCIPPGSSVHGTLQARILEWAAISSSRESSPPRDPARISSIAGRFFTTITSCEAQGQM